MDEQMDGQTDRWMDGPIDLRTGQTGWTGLQVGWPAGLKRQTRQTGLWDFVNYGRLLFLHSYNPPTAWLRAIFLQIQMASGTNAWVFLSHQQNLECWGNIPR